MIQRIQTVLLILAIALNIAVIFLPLWKIDNTGGGGNARLYGTKVALNETPGAAAGKTIGLGEQPILIGHLVLLILNCAWMVYVIFGFNDRPRQMQFGYIALVGLMIQMVLMMWNTRQLGEVASSAVINDGTFDIGFFFPVGAVLLVWLAIKRIKADEELVKSVDRFR